MTSLQETPVSQETDGLVGWIIEVQGDVRLKRKEWLDYRKASQGTDPDFSQAVEKCSKKRRESRLFRRRPKSIELGA